MSDVNEAAVTFRVQTGVYTDASYEYEIQFSKAMNTISSAISIPNMSCKHGLEWGLGWSMEIRNGGAMWTDYVVNVYCHKLQGKWNKNMPHVLKGVCTMIYTEIPCLGMSGSNDMAVLNQVCFQTLRHVNPIPNRILF